jgi:hypothetical protein
MHDDTRPTQADQDELRRHLANQGAYFQAIFEDGRAGRPADTGWESYGPEHLAWIAGRFERNRARQDVVLGSAGRVLFRALPRTVRAWRALRAAGAALRGRWDAWRDVRRYGPPVGA